MRVSFATALLVTLLCSGGYFYYVAGSVCPAPLSYKIGALDTRFNLSPEDARLAVNEAEAVWEEATGKNLFSYDEEGTLVVHFTYDERQELSNSEDLLKEKLDATQTVSDAMRDTYTILVAQYNEERLVYTQNVEAYESRLSAYNAEVEKYNERGGAPADVYAELENEKRQLAREQSVLNTYANKLSSRVVEINAIGEQANKIVNTYNQGVDVYNNTFGTSREFTQGDYKNSTINIYTFENHAELVLVLVHEMGHALGLDHVENNASVMHYLLHGGKDGESLTSKDVVLSSEDLAEFEQVCGQKNLVERLQIGFSRIWSAA
ncbi:MAG: hypothetical protein RLZZ76_654 [Candidatus Parcubacteria bacterium]